ncbi:hypothetical protein DENSPDRAFT_931206 [Dentipellis sp. KUC8613]|nr:hypothetical protein DENSPDRAFT_931206 [Dentipellis sp. KUC8613]
MSLTSQDTSTCCYIDKLPFEILAGIFSLICRPACGPSFRYQFHTGNPQVALSQVSQLWRWTSLQTSSLWSVIHITNLKQRSLLRAPIFLERSRDTPLDVIITWTLDYSKTSSFERLHTLRADFVSLLTQLIAHTPRWRLFHLVVNDFALMHHCLTSLSACDSAPILNRVVLDLVESVYDRSNTHQTRPLLQHLNPFHGNAPSLMYLSLGCIWLPFTSSFLHNLKSLNWDHSMHTGSLLQTKPTFVEFMSVLSQSPLLEELYFTSVALGDEVGWTGGVVELPSLRSLALKGISSKYGTALLRNLRLSNLRYLEVDLDDNDCTSFIRALLEPIDAGRTTLSSIETLVVENMADLTAPSPALYERMFGALSSLRILVYDCYRNPLYAFGAGCMSNIFPKLDTVVLPGVLPEELRAFVALRIEAGHPLSYAFADRDIRIGSEDESWLRQSLKYFGYVDQVQSLNGVREFLDLLEKQELGATSGGRRTIQRLSRVFDYTWHGWAWKQGRNRPLTGPVASAP